MDDASRWSQMIALGPIHKTQLRNGSDLCNVQSYGRANSLYIAVFSLAQYEVGEKILIVTEMDTRPKLTKINVQEKI